MRTRYLEIMIMMKSLEKNIGKEKTIEYLKQCTTERWSNYGKRQAEKSPDNSLST